MCGTEPDCSNGVNECSDVDLTLRLSLKTLLQLEYHCFEQGLLATRSHITFSVCECECVCVRERGNERKIDVDRYLVDRYR